jgi:hypothetical protein
MTKTGRVMVEAARGKVLQELILELPGIVGGSLRVGCVVILGVSLGDSLRVIRSRFVWVGDATLIDLVAGTQGVRR